MCQNSVARPYLFTHRDRHKHKHNLYKTRSHPPNCNQPLRLSGQLPCCHNQKPPCFFPECLTHFATFAHSEPNTLSAWSIYKYFFYPKLLARKLKMGKGGPKKGTFRCGTCQAELFDAKDHHVCVSIIL